MGAGSVGNHGCVAGGDGVAVTTRSPRAEPEFLSFEILTDLGGIEAIAQEWDALLEQSDCNRAFSSSIWFFASIRAGHPGPLHVIVARRQSAVVGILPLAWVEGQREAVFPSMLCDYNDLIAARDDGAAAVGLLKYATSGVKPYDKISLRFVRPDSHCIRALRRLHPECSFQQFPGGRRQCPHIRLPLRYEDYLTTRSARFRKTLRNVQNRAQHHHVTVGEIDPADMAPEQIPELFLSLHLRRFGSASCFATAAARGFIGELLPRLFVERRMRLFGVLQGKRIIAADLLMVGPDSLCAWNGGIADEALHLSPGRLLADAGIRRAVELGLKEYDFLRGTEEYKASWATDLREIGEIVLPVSGLASPPG